MRRVRALAVVFVICLCLVARAADALVGNVERHRQQPSRARSRSRWRSRLSESTVTGTISSDMGSETISDGKFDGETLSFATTYNGMPVAMSAKLTDGKLAGTFSVEWRRRRRRLGSHPRA